MNAPAFGQAAVRRNCAYAEADPLEVGLLRRPKGGGVDGRDAEDDDDDDEGEGGGVMLRMMKKRRKRR